MPLPVAVVEDTLFMNDVKAATATARLSDLKK